MLQAVRSVSRLTVREKHRDRLLQNACLTLIATHGYQDAWIALVDDSARPILRPAEGRLTVAQAGLGPYFLRLVQRLARGDLPQCGRRALEQSGPVITKDPPATCRECPLSAKYGGPGAMTGRLKHGNKIYGVLTVSLAADFVVQKEEQSVFQEVVDDIAFALHSLELEEERKRAEEPLEEQAQRLRALSARLAEVQEAERKQLAQELHDRVGQSLTVLGINLSLIRGQIPEGADLLRSRLEDSLLLVEETTGHIRNVMAELRPAVLDDYGLVAGLRWYSHQIASRSGIDITVEGQESLPRLDLPVENALFRIAQEALTNVIRHAQARQVMVSVEERHGTVRLVIADDGVGFDPARPDRATVDRDWGLLGMIERARGVGGRCRIESQPGSGTRVIVEVAR